MSLTVIELDVVGDLGRGNVQLNGIVHLHQWIGITEGATVMGDDEGHVLGSNGHLLHLAQLVFGLLGGNAVNGEATLHVVDQTEELSGLLDGHDI